jgi:twitching motility protein PilT
MNRLSGCVPVSAGGAEVAYDERRVLELLRDSLKADATDILIKVPSRPMFRSNYVLIATPYPPLQSEDTFQFARVLHQLARREMALSQVRDESFAFGIKQVGRFRAQLFRQRGSLAIVIHRIALQPPTLEEFSAPSLTDRIAWGGAGLTLVTGQRQRLGLVAALTDSFNTHHSGHLISIEDPVEYLHRDRKAIISQREIGEDADDYLSALDGLRRESPDAMIIHDIPSWEVAEAVLRVAEAGLPVVASLAGCRTTEAARWFSRMFPSIRESEICERLCLTMRGVIAEERNQVSVIPVSPQVREAVLKRRPLPTRKNAA